MFVWRWYLWGCEEWGCESVKMVPVRMGECEDGACKDVRMWRWCLWGCRWCKWWSPLKCQGGCSHSLLLQRRFNKQVLDFRFIYFILVIYTFYRFLEDDLMLDKCTTLWNQMDDETNDYLKTMIWRFENDDMEMISRLISSWHLSSSSMEQAVLVSIPSTMWASWELTMWASCEIDWNLLIEQLNTSHEVWQLNWNCNYRWICEYSIQDPTPLSEKSAICFL